MCFHWFRNMRRFFCLLRLLLLLPLPLLSGILSAVDVDYVFVMMASLYSFLYQPVWSNVCMCVCVFECILVGAIPILSYCEDCLKLNTVAASDSLHLVITVVAVVGVVVVVGVLVVVVDFLSFLIRFTESHSFIFIPIYMHASHRHTHRLSPLKRSQEQ